MTDWKELSDLVSDRDFRVTRVKLSENDISIEGEFDLPPLAKLSYEDQLFVAIFVNCHGSIKQMEKAFGVSYPTIKARLNAISDRIGLVEIQKVKSKNEILDMLEKGEITPQEATKRMKGK